MTHAAEWIVVGLLRASLGLSVAAAAVALCVRLARLRAPRAEQWAWLLVLVQGVVLVPASIPIARDSGAAAPPPRRGDAVIPTDEARAPAEAGTGALDGADREPALLPENPVAPRGEQAAERPAVKGAGFPWFVVAFAAWLAGACWLVGLGALRYVSFAGRLRRARPGAPEWQAEWRKILDARAVRASIPLVASRASGPALCRLPSGYRLVVPESSWAALAPAERDAILRHELAHYLRGDLWRTLLARVPMVVQWFNPLAWMAASRFEAQAEFLCDREASPGDPAAFAATLVRLASVPRDRVAAVQAARGDRLFDRVQRLLSETSRPSGWRCALPIAAAVLALGTSGLRIQVVEASGAATATSGPADAPRAAHELLRIGSGDLSVQNRVSAVAFSPDGGLVAAAEINATNPRVGLFDVRTGRLVKLLCPPDRPRGYVMAVAFSPDGKRLLWGEIGGEVALWDLSGDRLLFREKSHADQVNNVAFSPDGLLMASTGDDVVRLRRTAKPTEIVRELTRPDAALHPSRFGARNLNTNGGYEGLGALAFTPDGARLVVGHCLDAKLFVWRVADGRLDREISVAEGRQEGSSHSSPNCVAVTPDGRRIMVVGQTTKRREKTKLKYAAKNVTMSEVQFWDITDGRRLADYRSDVDAGFGRGALSRDGRRIAVADFGKLRILDAATGRAEWTIDTPGSWGERPAFSPDGKLVALPLRNVVALFEVSTGRRLLHDPGSPLGAIVSAAWSPSGDRLVIGHEDGYVRVRDAATGDLIWYKLLAPVVSTSGWNASPAFVSFSPDGKLVIVAGRRDDPVKWEDGILAVYEASSGRTVREVYQNEVRWAALAPDGRTAVVATSHGNHDDVHFIGIEVETGRMRWINPPREQRAGFVSLTGMRFRPDSSSFEAAVRGGDVIRLDALTGREQHRFLAEWRTPEQQKAQKPSDPDMWEAEFSADGRTLVSSWKEWIYVWDVESGAMRRKFRHPHPAGCRIALAPDGRTLATSDLNDVFDPGGDIIRLFDIEAGRQILALDPPDGRAHVMAFSPDGKRLFTGSGRGVGVVWDVLQGREAPDAKE